MSNSVSVILPTFQRAHIISEAIESVRKQTYTSWELIIVDDGSTDNTAEIVKSYTEKDSRIIYFKQKNKGVAAARNAALEKATGNYVAFIDSDDLWVTDKLERQIKLINKSLDCVLISGDVSYPDGGTFFSRHPLPAHINFKNLFIRNFIATSTVMLRREILNKIGFFNETIKSCEDYDLWLRIASDSTIDVIPEVFACYRTQPDSLTTDRFTYLASLLKIKSVYFHNPKLSLNWPQKYEGYYRYKLALLKLKLLKNIK